MSEKCKARTKRFTVRELLNRMTGVDDVGIYDINGDYLIVYAKATDIMLYADELIDRFNVWIYDDKMKTINGDEVDVKRIRCCIYLSRVKEEDE